MGRRLSPKLHRGRVSAYPSSQTGGLPSAKGWPLRPTQGQALGVLDLLFSIGSCAGVIRPGEKIGMLVYLDNNVLSEMADGKFPAVIEALRSTRVNLAYSQATFWDARKREDRGYNLACLLDRFPNSFLGPQDDGGLAVVPECSPFLAYRHAETRTEQLETILDVQRDILLHASDGELSPDLAAVEGALSEGIDGLNVSDGERKRLKREYLEALMVERSAKEVRSRMRNDFFPKDLHVNGIRPPNIVAKISGQFPKKVREKFLSLFSAEGGSFTDLYLGAKLLTYFGFGRKKALIGKNKKRAQSEAASDLLDYQHVSVGLHCSVFITCDRATAKRAYALKEFYGLECEVVLAKPDSQDCFLFDGETWDW